MNGNEGKLQHAGPTPGTGGRLFIKPINKVVESRSLRAARSENLTLPLIARSRPPLRLSLSAFKISPSIRAAAARIMVVNQCDSCLEVKVKKTLIP